MNLEIFLFVALLLFVISTFSLASFLKGREPSEENDEDKRFLLGSSLDDYNGEDE